MRLAARVDLDLDARMTLADPSTSASSGGSSSPVSSVRTSRPPSSSRSATAPATSRSRRRSRRRRRRRARARRPCARPPRRARRRARRRDLAGGDALERVEHRRLVLRRPSVRHRSATMAASPAGTDRDGTTRTGLSASPAACSAAEDHVRVVRQHDHLGRGRRLDRRDDLGRRGVHRLAALDHAGGPEALEQAAVALRPGATATTPVSSVGSPSSAAAEALLALARLLVHVRDLDAVDRPGRGRRARARRRGRRCGRAPSVRSGRRRRAASRRACSSSASSASASSPAPLDDEHGAVAELARAPGGSRRPTPRHLPSSRPPASARRPPPRGRRG